MYSGGEINARIGIANTDYKLSELQKEKALSDQILQANKIYLSAVKSDILLKYANQIIKEARPYFNRVKERVELGITDGHYKCFDIIQFILPNRLIFHIFSWYPI